MPVSVRARGVFFLPTDQQSDRLQNVKFSLESKSASSDQFSTPTTRAWPTWENTPSPGQPSSATRASTTCCWTKGQTQTHRTHTVRSLRFSKGPQNIALDREHCVAHGGGGCTVGYVRIRFETPEEERQSVHQEQPRLDLPDPVLRAGARHHLQGDAGAVLHWVLALLQHHLLRLPPGGPRFYPIWRRNK